MVPFSAIVLPTSTLIWLVSATSTFHAMFSRGIAATLAARRKTAQTVHREALTTRALCVICCAGTRPALAFCLEFVQAGCISRSTRLILRGGAPATYAFDGIWLVYPSHPAMSAMPYRTQLVSLHTIQPGPAGLGGVCLASGAVHRPLALQCSSIWTMFS